MSDEGLYSSLITKVFADRYVEGAEDIAFPRDALLDAADALGLPRPGNTGDILYAYRSRRPLPDAIRGTAPAGKEWVIASRGIGLYAFELQDEIRFEANEALIEIKIPDSTPELVLAHAQGDEQALLAVIRYNRLVDLFLGVTAYSLQNHLRTTVNGIGQIEIDEVYVGLGSHGAQFVIPVEAKTAKEQLGVVQIQADVAWCAERMPGLVARPVAAQFLRSGGVALFELVFADGRLRVAQERHYRLVPMGEISEEDLASYRVSVAPSS